MLHARLLGRRSDTSSYTQSSATQTLQNLNAEYPPLLDTIEQTHQVDAFITERNTANSAKDFSPLMTMTFRLLENLICNTNF